MFGSGRDRWPKGDDSLPIFIIIIPRQGNLRLFDTIIDNPRLPAQLLQRNTVFPHGLQHGTNEPRRLLGNVHGINLVDALADAAVRLLLIRGIRLERRRSVEELKEENAGAPDVDRVVVIAFVHQLRGQVVGGAYQSVNATTISTKFFV